MPWIGSNNTPSFPERSAEPQKPAAGGKDFITRRQFERSLDKDPKVRQELAKGLQKPLYSKEVGEAIKDIKKKLPQNLGSIIDKSKLRGLGSSRAEMREYQEAKEKLRELSKDGLTGEEVKELHREDFKRSFFKRLLGIDKHQK